VVDDEPDDGDPVPAPLGAVEVEVAELVPGLKLAAGLGVRVTRATTAAEASLISTTA